MKPFFDFRETLEYLDGLMVNDEAVVNQSLRDELKSRLLSVHLVYNSMMHRVRSILFWLGIAKYVEQMADSCEACQNSILEI